MLKAVAHYDNSKENKSNPDPTQDVYWGDQTWEEMQYTGLLYSIDKESDDRTIRQTLARRSLMAASVESGSTSLLLCVCPAPRGWA